MSTEPSDEMSRSSKVSWATVGKREDRVASLRSVDCSDSSSFSSSLPLSRFPD